MIKFRIWQGPSRDVRVEMDKWSASHPYCTLDDIEMDYHVDERGNWYILLAYRED